MDDNRNLLLAIEGFLRNTSYVEAPFMIKGSILTRQFFPPSVDRLVQDMDLVYLEKMEDVGTAEDIFSSWLIEVTTTNQDSKVWFRSFEENRFWRSIDYAMSDDFPTTNTDLYCKLEDGTVIDPLELDISFNLDIDFPPDKMLYKPLFGSSFILDKVCPYALQVSWKLHQLLVRPRLKDIFDLIYLLQSEQLDEGELEKILFALKKECKRDGISAAGLLPYINGTFAREKEQLKIRKPTFVETLLKGNKKPFNPNILTEEDYKHFTTSFPFTTHSELLRALQDRLVKGGFTEQLIFR